VHDADTWVLEISDYSEYLIRDPNVYRKSYAEDSSLGDSLAINESNGNPYDSYFYAYQAVNRDGSSSYTGYTQDKDGSYYKR